MGEEEATSTSLWQAMSAPVLVFSLGTVAAIVSMALYITNSTADGLGYLWSLPVAWLGFGFVVGVGAPLTLLGYAVFWALLYPVSDEDIKDKIYLAIRWVVFFLGLGWLAWFGYQGVADGLRTNRLVPVETLYQQCMEPKTMKIDAVAESCRDGWNSSSIGKRGACSHHGGVVRRWYRKDATYQLGSPESCRAEARRRSWMD